MHDIFNILKTEDEPEFYCKYRKSGQLSIGMVSFSDANILESYYNADALKYMKNILPAKSVNIFTINGSNGIVVYSYEEAISYMLCNWHTFDNDKEELRLKAFFPFMSLSDTQYFVKCDKYPMPEEIYVIFEGLSRVEGVIPVSVDSFLSALITNIQEVTNNANTQTSPFGQFEAFNVDVLNTDFVLRKPPFTWVKVSPGSVL
jgi:hypothetical protein